MTGIDFTKIENAFADLECEYVEDFPIARTKSITQMRANVIASIDDNQELLKDPSYKKIAKSGKSVTPTRLFDICGDYALVCLRYGKVKLQLAADGKRKMKFPTKDLPDVLVRFRKLVSDGIFDSEIEYARAQQCGKRKSSKSGAPPAPSIAA